MNSKPEEEKEESWWQWDGIPYLWFSFPACWYRCRTHTLDSLLKFNKLLKNALDDNMLVYNKSCGSEICLITCRLDLERPACGMACCARRDSGSLVFKQQMPGRNSCSSGTVSPRPRHPLATPLVVRQQHFVLHGHQIEIINPYVLTFSDPNRCFGFFK